MDNNNSKDLVPQNAWNLEIDWEYTQTLENLLDEVNVKMREGLSLQDVLYHRTIPQENTLDNNPMPYDKYTYNQFDLYQSRTSKGYKPAIGIRHICNDIWDAIYYITRNHEVFRGRIHGTVSIVETVMIHLGLRGIDRILQDRPSIVKERLDAIHKGSKERRKMGKLPRYVFVNFTEKRDDQQNVWCQNVGDYARMGAIAEDYDWTMSFVVQMAMIVAMACSEKLPEEMRKNAVDEVRCFIEFLDKYF